ncbi:sulfotransferase family 2 domain-containing protein [Erythrobacter ani]|uniref:Sulfotransferase family 2 domain-containing protein n=1 Tax=Erythrobacter ani TaxID=2827235 RepID=A0ABS6SR78_9SPHN|nr:sulfotransferase family 2 domain-containing protein [Erythrobacter ani]MBV7266977.1 sulfotransferase family 2 domain-containing protein [Erythrobacter ani]
MHASQLNAAGVGRLSDALRGLVIRKERHRARASYFGRAPMAFQRIVSNRVGKPVFTQANRRHRAIWIHIPKNAGTSLRTGLGFDDVGHQPIARYAAHDAAAVERYFKFAIVRNPWDRLQSAFRYLRRHPVGAAFDDAVFADRNLRQFADFEEFVLAMADDRAKRGVLDYTHFLPQLFWLTLPGEDGLKVDYVGRFENLGKVYSELSERFQTAGDLPDMNSQRVSNFRELYTPTMRDIVAEMYASDIAAFDYQFDEATRGPDNA